MTARPVCAVLAALVVLAFARAEEPMQAIVASDGNVSLTSVPRPEPGEGQVRIKVRAASVNPVDWKLAQRAAPGTRVIPGRDLAGIIDAVGPGADRWRAGDAVIAVAAGGSVGGSYAQYALASVRAVASKPARMSFEEAAGIPVVGETAWRAIVTVGDVQKGQRVLVHGGAGGVGSSAVQVAKARGAYVIATASESHREFVRSLGADEVLDYHAVRFEEHLKNLDLVLNTVDADTGMRSLSVLKPGGMLVSVVGAMPPEACAAAKVRCAITGSVTGELLAPLVELANAGKFRVHIEQQLSLGEAAQAWSASRAGHTGGKIVLRVSN